MVESLLKERVYWATASKKTKTRSWDMKSKPSASLPGRKITCPPSWNWQAFFFIHQAWGEKDIGCFERIYI